jgi:nitrate reductase delta subunit
MRSGRLNAIAAVGRALQYPAAGYADNLQALAALCGTLECPQALARQELADRASSSTVESLQELFTQTFDLTPACALEVGWHLYGDEYERGTFMVRMREQLRAHRIDEGTELPDHLASLLELIARTPDDVGTLIDDALVPAIGKMLANLEKNASPFHPMMAALGGLLAAEAAAARERSHV